MSYQKPLVSITVVAFNSARCIGDCLLSVRPDVESGFAELLVVDNASPDESAQLVQRQFPEAILIRSEVNRKYAGGCNLAWPQARGRYWLLLNPDCVVPEGGLQELVGWMERHPELGAASPELVDRKGRVQSAGRRFQTISKSLLELSRLHLLLPRRVRSDLFLGSYWKGGDHLNVDWVPGSALLVRREAVEDAGLLSEDVLFYGEDSEWCWRIGKAGWRIGVCSQVQFEHQEGQSTSRTWTDEERNQRVWLGIYDACRKMRGALYTRALVVVNTIAFAIESCHPGRSEEQQSFVRRALKAHLLLLRGREATRELREIGAKPSSPGPAVLPLD